MQLRAMERKDGLAITAFLQVVDFQASAERCRSEWWPGTKNATQVEREDLQETTKNGIARVEYIIPEFRGVRMRQKNVHAYLGSGDLCAEVHLSKASFDPSDQTLFEQVLDSVKLLPQQESASAADVSPSTDDKSADFYFRQGSVLYLQQNYAGAAEAYERALALEKVNRTLSRDYFRVLVDNLGMSYGITGDLVKARATFEYGLTQDPEYPMFFYNMACVYGEQGKMNESIAQLRLAYKNKANSIPGEGIPDPMKDDSFRYFVANQTFIDAVRDMQK